MVLMDQVKYHAHRHLAAPAAFHSLGCSDAPYFTDRPAQRMRPSKKTAFEPGKKFSFDQEHAANLSLERDAGFWGGTSGEVEITKLDGGWMEGKFAYKATSSSSTQTIEVADGFFRVPFAGTAGQ